MINYKMAIIPAIPFGLGQITNGLKAIIEVGIFTFVFVFLCLLLNNFIVEPLLNKKGDKQ